MRPWVTSDRRASNHCSAHAPRGQVLGKEQRGAGLRQGVGRAVAPREGASCMVTVSAV